MRRRLGFAAIYTLQLVDDGCRWAMATIADHLFPVPPEADTRRHP